jgi:hypothetical protein
MPLIVFLPEGSQSGALDSFNFITVDGINTTTYPVVLKANATIPTNPLLRCYPT